MALRPENANSVPPAFFVQAEAVTHPYFYNKLLEARLSSSNDRERPPNDDASGA